MSSKMKANNGKGNTPLRDMWETPQELWNKIYEQYKFTFDCCANKNNHKVGFYTSDFEIIPIKTLNENICWMNPPFSIAWRMFEHFFKVIKKGVAIYRCDNLETGLWQKVILKNADWIFIPNKRICYEGFDGNGSRFPSALIGIGVEPPKELNGTILRVNRKNDN